MKVLLFNTKAKGFRVQDDIIAPPLALLAIAGFVLQDKHEVTIIDSNVNSNYRDELNELLPYADCLGITAMTGYPILSGLEAAKLARHINPNLPIIWGGYHPSILPEQTARSEYVDFVVRGQGEVTFRELVNTIASRGDFEKVRGLTFRNGNGEIVNTPMRFFEDINNFPTLPWHLIDVEKYITTDVGSRTIGYRTSQGCPFNCGFCAETVMTGRRWSGLSCERVIDELKFLVNKYQIDAVTLHDSNFFADKERVRGMFKSILDEKLDIAFGSVNGRPEQIAKFDDDFLDLLSKVKCKDIFIGTESGSDEILRFINKCATVQDTIKAKRVCSKHNIGTCIALMLGFPRDEKFTMPIRKEFSELLNLVDRILEIDKNNSIGIMLYTPYPGTNLFDIAVKNGIRRSSKLEDWYNYIFSFTQASWIPKKYELLTDQLNKFIFPYISSKFIREWDRCYKGKNKKFKKLLHILLRTLAKLRLKYRFFALPFEYKLIMNFSSRRFITHRYN